MNDFFPHILTSVSDPHWCQCRSGSRSRVLIIKKLKKFTAEKNNIFFWSKFAKIYIYMYLGFHKGRPSYRRSLQSSKEKFQHFKTWNFFPFFYFWRSFLPFWIRIRIRIQPTKITELWKFTHAYMRTKHCEQSPCCPTIFAALPPSAPPLAIFWYFFYSEYLPA
jgi:hypothetical protein